MSNLPGNPHVVDPDGAATLDARLTASATLALAYEQRTANLIALAEFEREPINPDYDMETIYNRLGLGDNK